MNGNGARGLACDASDTGPVLSVSDITRRFGVLTALDGLSFDIRRGEILGIAGPNGAGKSTLLNVCSGALKAHGGSILMDGERVDGLPPYRLCHKGLGRTFQIPRVFDSLSVGENVMIGGSFGRAARTRRGELARQVDAVLKLTGLDSQRDTPAGLVDLLTRKLIMLAAVMATRSKLVLMDEPLAGLNAEETDRYVDLVLRLHSETGVTFALVEHKIRTLTRVCDRIMIMHFGRVLCIDTPQAVVRDQRVIDAYLGEQFDA